ncbi:MAG: hypothetical protein J2P18_06370 [Nocardia sp.]|nr:hypothetical protein [Nocardia sp.]
MKFGTFAAISILATTAIGIGTGTAYAGPAAAPGTTPSVTSPAQAAPVTRSGTDRGVAYQAVLSDFSRVLTTSVQKGHFELNHDATAVALKSDAGENLTTVPLAYQLSGQTVHVAQHISEDGHKLVLEPQNGKEIGQMQPVGSMTRLTNEINKNIVGIVAGGVIGGIIGAILGFGFFSIITGPIGLVVGAAAGGLVMGGQSFQDAAFAVLTGRP